jgi:hypothetical protein
MLNGQSLVGLGMSAPLATEMLTNQFQGSIFSNAGNPLGANKADLTDDILAGFQLPSWYFGAGRSLEIWACGTTGATTNNKRFKVFINPTTAGAVISSAGVYSNTGTVTAGTPVCDSGTWINATTPNSGAGWCANVTFQKYGTPGSNTQFAQGSPILGTLHGGVQAAQFLTLTESAPINIVVTGSSYTTGAANDVLLQLFQVLLGS